MKKIPLTILLLFSMSCTKSPPQTCDVIVSIPPYEYFVLQLMGNETHVLSLVPPGANPHIYEPSPHQLEAASHARVWIQINEIFEKNIGKSLASNNPSLAILNLANALPKENLLTGSTACQCGKLHGIDVHFWLSLRLAKEEARLIAKTLSHAFPLKKSTIEKNLITLLNHIENTDRKISEELLPLANTAILVSHPAFAYFCKDYQLTQLSVEFEGKDPLPQQIETLLQTAQSKKTRVALTQMQYSNKGTTQIAQALHIPIYEVNPYSADYLDNLLHIAHIIANP